MSEPKYGERTDKAADAPDKPQEPAGGKKELYTDTEIGKKVVGVLTGVVMLIPIAIVVFFLAVGANALWHLIFG